MHPGRRRFFFGPGALRAAILLALLAAGRNDTARGCSCIEGDTPPSLWRNSAPDIFLAQAIDVRGPYSILEGERSFRFEHDRWFRMHVVSTWKGDMGDTVLVQTGSGGGDCGYSFALGGLYLVYAWGTGDTLRTGICTRTRPWTSAHEDSLALGAPERDRSEGRLWAAFAPPISCPVHSGLPVRLTSSAIVYGMLPASEDRFWSNAAQEYPYAGVQLAAGQIAPPGLATR